MISIIIPVYRSAESLPILHRRLVYLFEQRGDDFETMFVEDCGGDNSWDIIKGLAAADPRVRGFRMSRNYGQHNALLCGIRAARGEVIVTMDDEALILDWANDPLVRRNAFNPNPIDPESHRAWFRKRLRDLENCRRWKRRGGPARCRGCSVASSRRTMRHERCSSPWASMKRSLRASGSTTTRTDNE